MMPSLIGRSNALRADVAVQGSRVDAATTPVARRKSRFDGMNRFTGSMPFWVVKDIASKQVRRDATHSRFGEIGFKDAVER